MVNIVNQKRFQQVEHADGDLEGVEGGLNEKITVVVIDFNWI